MFVQRIYYFKGIGYKDIEYEDIGYTAKIALKNIQKLLVMYRKIAVIWLPII